MKKLILIILVAALLAACGSNDETEDAHVHEATEVITSYTHTEDLADEYEVCDCGMFSARYMQELHTQLSSPSMNIQEVGPFGHATHFTYQFETVHTASYLQLEYEWASYLAIWSDEPIYDFSFVSVHHNAICCAYVGEVLLAIDILHPRDVVLLTVSFTHYLFPRGGIIFTDAGGLRHHMFISESMIGGCAPRFFLWPTNSLIDRREDWLDLGIISIPATFSYDKSGLHGDITIIASCPFVPSRDVWEETHVSVGHLRDETIEVLMERSLSTQTFLFDDGHMGHMLELPDAIWWVREDWLTMSFWHGGYRYFFEIHEGLILEIARTLTADS